MRYFILFLLLCANANAAYFGAWSPQNIPTIATTDAIAVSAPYLNSGTNVQYYCDCTGVGQTCAAAGMTSGNDTTGAGTQVSPYQTIQKAWTWLNSGTNRTVALCQGGAFAAPSANGLYGLVAGVNSGCAAGTICNEIREYPVSGTFAKPIIINNAGNYYLFSTINGGGGLRFMNLRWQGTQTLQAGGQNVGLFAYVNHSLGRPNIHDITIWNVDIDSFDIGVDDSVDLYNSNFALKGNHFTNVLNWGYVGASSNLLIGYNSFINTGSDNAFDHAIYFAPHDGVTNAAIVGNYITGFSVSTTNNGSTNNTNCVGGPFTAHAAITNLTVSGNIVNEANTAEATCWGISFTDTTSVQNPVYLYNAIFSNNIIVNGGNTPFAVDNCPSCIIQNNLIITQESTGGAGSGAGISAPNDISRSQDPIMTGATISNNTIYFDSNVTVGTVGGIFMQPEGTGYKIANNTVMYANSSALYVVNCYNYGPSVAALSFVNNNNCYSTASNVNWAFNASTGYATPAAWNTFSSLDGVSSYASPGWSFATPLTIPAWNDSYTPWQWIGQAFVPTGTVLPGKGSHTYAPYLDATNWLRANPPAIGAYE